MKSNTIRLKWAGPNAPYIEFRESAKKVYPTKQELFDLKNLLEKFIEEYKEDFTPDRISDGHVTWSEYDPSSPLWGNRNFNDSSY